jgi:hypothetical protein
MAWQHPDCRARIGVIVRAERTEHRGDGEVFSRTEIIAVSYHCPVVWYYPETAQLGYHLQRNCVIFIKY